MTFFGFSCMALPLWAAMYYLFFSLKKEKLFRESAVVKCAGSFLSVCSCAAALLLKEKSPLGAFPFWFFLLCTGADVLLESSFVPGMLAFGAGHICLICWLWSCGPVTLWSLLLWAAAVAAAYLLFRRELSAMGPAAIPFVLYALLLSGSLALALPLAFTAGGRFWTVSLAAVFFFSSDLMVAADALTGVSVKRQKPIMALYWAALYLFSAALW